MYAADSRTPWSTLDEQESWSPLVALPGHKKLGLGRHWHFLSIQFWILTGVVYVVMIFTTGYWHYLVPTSWSIVPDSIRSIGTYLQFKIPPTIPGQPFESAQKLAYFLVILVLAPPADRHRRRHVSLDAGQVPVVRATLRRQARSAQSALPRHVRIRSSRRTP